MTYQIYTHVVGIFQRYVIGICNFGMTVMTRWSRYTIGLRSPSFTLVLPVSEHYSQFDPIHRSLHRLDFVEVTSKFY